MPNSSRVWIYQASRIMRNSEILDIEKGLYEFCSNWKSHNNDVYASFKLYKLFICIIVDETNFITSGCSIDSSVNYIKSLSLKYDINFFNRTNIVYEKNDQMNLCSLSNFKNIITAETLIYDNAITSKKQLQFDWKVKVADSWLSKFLK